MLKFSHKFGKKRNKISQFVSESVAKLDLLITIPPEKIILTPKARNDINAKARSFRRSKYFDFREKWRLLNSMQLRDFAGIRGPYSQTYLARRLSRRSKFF